MNHSNASQLIIRARDQRHVDQFLRALTLASDNPSGVEIVLVNSPAEQVESMAWKLAQTNSAKGPSMQPNYLGRYTSTLR